MSWLLSAPNPQNESIRVSGLPLFLTLYSFLCGDLVKFVLYKCNIQKKKKGKNPGRAYVYPIRNVYSKHRDRLTRRTVCEEGKTFAIPIQQLYR
ncbi:hypothetical protein SCA6_007545 [Theobroma cacao]